MVKPANTRILLLALLLGLCSFLSLRLWQGSPYLFDWDELIYASLARQMVESGDWQQMVINGQPFFEKPPLFIWLQALSFEWFGLSAAAARFPSALAGGILTAGVVTLGSRWWSLRLGCIWGILLNVGMLPVLFAKTGLIDPVFNLAMLSGLGSLFEYEQSLAQPIVQPTPPPPSPQRPITRNFEKRPRPRPAPKISWIPWLWIVMAATCLGLAVLAKGPLGLGLPLAIWILYKLWQRDPWPPVLDVLLFMGVAGIFALSWYGAAGPEFWRQFWAYQVRIASTADGGRGGPVYFHLLVYILGCIPFASLSLQQIWIHLRQINWKTGQRLGIPTELDPRQKAGYKLDDLVLIAFLVVLALFSFGIQTKLIHYTSLLYPLGSYLAARRLDQWLSGQTVLRYAERFWILLSGGIWAFLLLLLPWIGRFPLPILTWIEDPLARGYLEAGVEWPRFTFIPGILLGISLLVWRLLVPRRVDPLRAGQVWRGILAWILLGVGVWSSTQLTWHWISSRILQHSQEGAITFLQDQSSQQSPTALYGFVTFIPYFYGPRQMPNPIELEILAALVAEGEIQRIITLAALEPDLRSSFPDWTIQKNGAYIVLDPPPQEIPLNPP